MAKNKSQITKNKSLKQSHHDTIPITENKSLRDAYGKTLLALGEENPNIVVLDADLSTSTRTALFGERYPDRFFNMGISEADMIGTAAGLATLGFIPFVSTFAVFGTGRCYDQIRQSICLSNLNVKIVTTHGGLTVGEDGASHQMLEDISLMRGLPRMNIIVPADAEETIQVIRFAAEHKGPLYIRLSREKFPLLSPTPKFKLGKGHYLKKGNDIALIACGLMVHYCLEAAESLSKDGINTSVINLSTIKPLDTPLIKEIAETCGAILTVEEHSIFGGLGSSVAEAVVANKPVPMTIMGVKNVFGESGKPEELLRKHGLTPNGILKRALELFKRKKI